MLILGFTGFYIHNPFFNWNMQQARTLHFIFMYVVLWNLVARVYWAFFGKGTDLTKTHDAFGRDSKNFMVQEMNKGKFLETVKYYLFLRKTHPATAKFNTLQKGTYNFWALLLLVQGYTGFAIYGPFMNLGFFEFGTGLVGGLMNMRMIHYFIMWVFIITSMIHIYLATAEDFVQLPLMFFWKETPAKEH
jgi:Ni/Fe-hydrogenase 1 B-type cytochrome subunit